MIDATITSTAARDLEAAFAAKARYAPAGDLKLGVFGGDFPPALAAASGFAAIDVEMEPDADSTLHDAAIEALIEPFVDHAARRFLHRLSCGAFDGLSAILFSRASPAAYLAWLYACEFRRQGLMRGLPELLLWNMQLTRSAAAETFNLAEASKLERALVALGGHEWTKARLHSAVADEIERRDALRLVERCRREGRLYGGAAMRLRNAGRYMRAKHHARLLEDAMADFASAAPAGGLRLGLAGSPTASTDFYRLLEEFGTVIADPHPWGQAWPPPCPPNAAGDLADLLAATASNPLDPRSLPVPDHRQAIAAACIEARCDLVLFQMDEHDDCFGWDLPAIRDALESAGVRTLELGPRPAQPDAAWLVQVRDRIASAVAALNREAEP